jgi:acyl-CoA thioester hydrolase
VLPIFVDRLTIGADSIDLNGHVNNQEYVRWMQDVATAHSSALGWSFERYLATGVTWVIRSHFIEYLRPAFKDDEVLVVTWVAAMDTQTSPRQYRFVRARDGKTLVEAETRWVFCDLKTGRPRDIPDEVRAAFPIVTEPADIQAAINLARGR